MLGQLAKKAIGIGAESGPGYGWIGGYQRAKKYGARAYSRHGVAGAAAMSWRKLAPVSKSRLIEGAKASVLG